jgi:hypothetical protein
VIHLVKYSEAEPYGFLFGLFFKIEQLGNSAIIWAARQRASIAIFWPEN